MLDHELPAPARAALAAYRARLAAPDDPRPLVVAWAPGRVNLIGEHTDYNGGYVLPVGIDRVVAFAGRASSDGAVELYSAHHDESAYFPAADFAARSTAFPATPPLNLPTWARYPRAVLTELAALPDPAPASPSADLSPSAPYLGASALRRDPADSVGASGGRPWPPIPAFTAAISGDVPLGGGLSSSAALEVATATFAAALGAPALPPMETALLCQRAEHRGVGVLCGILDQAASCLARADAALLLDCRSLAYEYVPFELPDLALAVFDTGAPHTLADSGYNERRRQCEAAVALLAAAIAHHQPDRAIDSLRDVTPVDLAAYGSALPDLLLRRARHVVSENARVLRATDALRTGDAATLGALISASHASLRDDYAVSCAELDAAVEIATTVTGVFGARMIGAGFGGSALILVRRAALPHLEAALARDYAPRSERNGFLHVCRISGGPASTILAE